jgi:hypothetical protein
MPDTSLQEFDRKLASSVVFKITDASGIKEVQFQFAPKITSESNSSNWIEAPFNAFHPARRFQGAGGRKLTMEWEYIASDKEFDAAKVATQIRAVKSYFYDFIANLAIWPLAKVQHTNVIPIETDFILRDLAITYGPELINNNGVHPLYTKVVTQLDLMTNISVVGQPKLGGSLRPLVKPDWY